MAEQYAIAYRRDSIGALTDTPYGAIMVNGDVASITGPETFIEGYSDFFTADNDWKSEDQPLNYLFNGTYSVARLYSGKAGQAKYDEAVTAIKAEGGKTVQFGGASYNKVRIED